MGEPAQDVDLWIQASKEDALRFREHCEDLHYVETLSSFSSQNFDKFIKGIVNVVVQGHTIQCIFVEDAHPAEVIGRFCCSLSEAIWDPDTDSIKVSPDYKESRRTGKVKFYTDQTGPRAPSDSYLPKMKARYPDYEFILINR